MIATLSNDNAGALQKVMVSSKPSPLKISKLGIIEGDPFLPDSCLVVSSMTFDASCAAVRWLGSVRAIHAKLTAESNQACLWRRLQTADQQAEREKKNVVQKVLTFSARARQLQVEDCIFRLLYGDTT